MAEEKKTTTQTTTPEGVEETMENPPVGETLMEKESAEPMAEEQTPDTEQAGSTEEGQDPSKEGGKAKKILWNILRGVGYAILAFLVVAAGWLAIDKLIMKATIPQAYGVSALNVKTDSMNGNQKGSFAGGDVIFIWRHPDADNLKVGDIITFWEVDGSGKAMKDKLPTTHRITRVNEDGTYVTQGDNPQNSEDINPVKPENVVGVVLFHIPKAGHFINWISTGGGALYLVAFGALIIGLIYVAKKKEWN
ncbi:MAG: signal peptidase I [Clostridiales bacterium]|nr:signal peptidase I [Clostridiales bacterium]